MRRWLFLFVLLLGCSKGTGETGDDTSTPCCDGGGSGSGTGTGTGTGSGTGTGTGTGTGSDIDGGGNSVCTNGLGAWTGHDHVPASQNPPCGLAVSDVPQFVSLGFDDNAYSGLDGTNGTGGVTWAAAMAAARGVHVSFYLTSIYIDTWESESPTYVKRAWHAAWTAGNEIGDHTRTHSHGAMFDTATWQTEIGACLDTVELPFDPDEVNYSPDATKGIGASPSDLVGFRTPFLEYDDATFTVLQDLNFHYDCSIEDGFEDDQDGTNYYWPYTLDDGSPGNQVLVDWGLKEPLTSHPGLWELPISPVIVPPDDKCAQYGVPAGLRDRLKARQDWFDTTSGKITGFDYNLWVQFAMTKAEFLATVEYTLDQRLAGNRSPFMLGVHSDIYSSKYTAATGSTVEERQQAIEAYLDYALSKPEVRVRPNQEILSWVRNPSPL